MELEDLKNIWKKNEPSFKPKDEAQLAAMLRGNSNSIVSKLKKSVWFELIFTLTAGVVLLIYALTLPAGALKWTSLSILLLLVGYTFYYIKKINLLNNFNPANENIREGLERLIENLSSYLKFYKQSYTVLYPVYFGLGIAFGLLERGATHFFEAIKQPRTILLLSIVGIIFYFCSTWLTKWYLKKLYGNHLEKLKSLLTDLKS